jgi:hypothetical protein
MIFHFSVLARRCTFTRSQPEARRRNCKTFKSQSSFEHKDINAELPRELKLMGEDPRSRRSFANSSRRGPICIAKAKAAIPATLFFLSRFQSGNLSSQNLTLSARPKIEANMKGSFPATSVSNGLQPI